MGGKVRPSPSHMTDQDTITLGLSAEALMADETFNSLYATVTERISKDILATSLDDQTGREHLYATFNGMRSFIQYINQFRIAKDQVVERLNFQNEIDD